MTIGLALLGAVASATAEAEVKWSGPGWYVEETSMGFDYALVAGPYSDEASCNASKPADNDDYGYICINEPSDPDGGGG